MSSPENDLNLASYIFICSSRYFVNSLRFVLIPPLLLSISKGPGNDSMSDDGRTSFRVRNTIVLGARFGNRRVATCTGKSLHCARKHRQQLSSETKCNYSGTLDVVGAYHALGPTYHGHIYSLSVIIITDIRTSHSTIHLSYIGLGI